MSVVMRQWFANFIVMLVELDAKPLHPVIMGFTPGHQVLHITETIRLLLNKAREWKRPVVISQQDIMKAYEYLRSTHVDRAMCQRGIGPELRLALCQLSSMARMKANVNDTWSRVFAMERGGITGGTETTVTWNTVVSEAIRPMLEEWSELRLGFAIEADEGVDGVALLLNLLVWADNFIGIGTTWEMKAEQIIRLSSTVAAVDLQWKEGESKIMNNQFVPEVCAHPAARLTRTAFIVQTCLGEIVYKRVDAMDIVVLSW